jgi:hypothetical protein
MTSNEIIDVEEVKEIKLTDAELEGIRTLTQQVQQATFQFGQLNIQRIAMNELETRLKDEWLMIKKNEVQLTQQLAAKYGDGHVDLSRLVFVKK